MTEKYLLKPGLIHDINGNAISAWINIKTVYINGQETLDDALNKRKEDLNKWLNPIFKSTELKLYNNAWEEDNGYYKQLAGHLIDKTLEGYSLYANVLLDKTNIYNLYNSNPKFKWIRAEIINNDIYVYSNTKLSNNIDILVDIICVYNINFFTNLDFIEIPLKESMFIKKDKIYHVTYNTDIDNKNLVKHASCTFDHNNIKAYNQSDSRFVVAEITKNGIQIFSERPFNATVIILFI